MELQIKDAKATGGGCDCGCGGHDAPAAALAEVAAAACNCGPDCTCGCQEGLPCTCGDASASAHATASTDASEPAALGAAGAATGSYRVSGMTCGHCVKSVTEEVSAIPGVTHVDVDLATGAMKVTSEAPIDFDRIVEAVAEAGDYTVS